VFTAAYGAERGGVCCYNCGVEGTGERVSFYAPGEEDNVFVGVGGVQVDGKRKKVSVCTNLEVLYPTHRNGLQSLKTSRHRNNESQ